MSEVVITAKELGVLRKKVQKASLEELQSGDLLSLALEVITTHQPDDLVLEILSLHLSVYRQLRFLFEADPSQRIADLVHDRLGPSLVPGQACAESITSSLDSSVRTRNLRGTEALSAAARMIDVLPPPSSSSSASTNPLVPLLHFAASSSVLGRSEMVLTNVLLPHVPTTAVPSGLLEKLLSETDNLDLASIRCNIAANILLSQASSNKAGESITDQMVLEPILHLFDEQDNMTLLNLTRYLLPTLFAARPSSIKALLGLLADTTTGKDRFSAWISVASLGVAGGNISIIDLPKNELEAAIVHEDTSVRLRVFQLLASADIAQKETLDYVKRSFKYNAVLPSAGARSELLSAVHSYFKKLREAKDSASRGGNADSRLEVIGNFQNWILENIVDAGILVACRHPVVEAIFALGVLKHFVDVFGQDRFILKQVFSEDWVTSLFACQLSEFTEVRARARTVLEGAQVDLADYEQISSPATQLLLQSSLVSLNNPRKTQAEAGKSALCIVFQKLLASTSVEEKAIAFVQDLCDRMESHIAMSEQNLPKGIETMPLHGIIAATRDVISCINVRDAASQVVWAPIFDRLVKAVDRVWTVTGSVISLAPSLSSDASKPDHEIARAYDVLGAGDEEDGDEAMDHTNLLSGCWRATKEAAELLATLFRLPLAQAGNQQTMWNSEQVDLAGKRFLSWMHEIRHRGTFSKVALAFTELVDAVKGVDALKPLCSSWLQHELDIITTDSLSTTRRSAALPYSVLAIVSADQVLLDDAFECLNELAKVNNARSSDITKVHAFNILKIVLLDSKQAKLLDRYFERAVMTALHAFASPNWNVRNVGLILFSTIVHRSLAPGRGTQDYYASKSTLASRQTLANWHNRFPSVIPHITQIISELSVSSASSSNSLNAHSPLFPNLIIVRSLRWSAAGAELAGKLVSAIKPLLRSKEWQVRRVAAQALSSLISPESAPEIVLESISASPAGNNERHGLLLLSRHLVLDVIDWTSVEEARRAKTEHALRELMLSSESDTPLVAQAKLDLVTAYIGAAPVASNETISALVVCANRALSSKSSQPGHSLLIASASNAVLRYDQEEQVLARLLSNNDEDVHLPALANAAALIRRGEVSQSTVDGIIEIVLKANAMAAQIAAFEALCDVPITSSTLLQCAPGTPQKIMARAKTLALGSKCVPLQEAALALYGFSLAWSSASQTEREAGFNDLAKLIDRHSEVNASQPSRNAALLALRPFATMIYSWHASQLDTKAKDEATITELHHLLLRLLQDDDESIRTGAAEIVRTGLGLKRSICQKRAMELEFEHIGFRATSSDSEETWSNLLQRPLSDEPDFASELRRLETKIGTTDVLFEVEPPNLFRDPIVEMTLAADTVKRIMKQAQGEERWSGLEKMVREKMTRAEEVLKSSEGIKFSERVSPIDEKYDLRRKMKMRLVIWRGLVEAEGS